MLELLEQCFRPYAAHSLEKSAPFQCQQGTGRSWVSVVIRADFKEISILGHGNFSKVFRVRGRRDGCEYAIKRSLREIGSDASYQQWSKVMQQFPFATKPEFALLKQSHFCMNKFSDSKFDPLNTVPSLK